MPKIALAGFDIGTSKIRCILFKKNGKILFNSSFRTPLISKKDGFYNPVDEINNITLKILKKNIYLCKKK